MASENLKANQVTNGTALVSDGFQSLPDDLQFDWVVTNPQIRAGKAVVYGLLKDAYDSQTRWRPYGVIRTKQGSKAWNVILSIYLAVVKQ